MIKVGPIRALAWGMLALLGSVASAAGSGWTDKVDAAIEDAITRQQIPGAVVWSRTTPSVELVSSTVP